MSLIRDEKITDELLVVRPSSQRAYREMGALVALFAGSGSVGGDAAVRVPLWRADVERLVEVLQEALR